MAANSQSGDKAITFFRKDQVIYDISRIVGHDVSHLTTQQLENLINAIPNSSQTQTPAVGDEERNTTVRNDPTRNWLVHSLIDWQAVVQPATPLGLGGGYYRDRLEGMTRKS
jgi:hypothetical protein